MSVRGVEVSKKKGGSERRSKARGEKRGRREIERGIGK